MMPEEPETALDGPRRASNATDVFSYLGPARGLFGTAEGRLAVLSGRAKAGGERRSLLEE